MKWNDGSALARSQATSSAFPVTVEVIHQSSKSAPDSLLAGRVHYVLLMDDVNSLELPAHTEALQMKLCSWMACQGC
jgi:hypothetical protein